MPSSGYGAVSLLDVDHPETPAKAERLIKRARHAMEVGLFVEWLESFLAAWEATKDVDVASFAGLVEWDM